MSSVTNTLAWFLPLWTRKVCPTNSGTIVQARFQVLIGSRFMTIDSTLVKSFGSLYGHFLVERLIAKLPRRFYQLPLTRQNLFAVPHRPPPAKDRTVRRLLRV